MLRRRLSHALHPCTKTMKLHHLLLHWINLKGLKSFLHQLGSVFTLRYLSLHPQQPYARVFIRFHLGPPEKWWDIIQISLDGVGRLMLNRLTHLPMTFSHHSYVLSTSNSSLQCYSSFPWSMAIKPFLWLRTTSSMLGWLWCIVISVTNG